MTDEIPMQDGDGIVLIYKIENLVSGKCYIGLTRTSTAARWKSHVDRAGRTDRNGALQCAIRKYGRENFSISELYQAISVREAIAVERAMITSHNTLSPNGYNMTTGGDVVPSFRKSLETRKKMSAGRKTPAALEAMKKLHDKLRGKPLLSTTKAKISATLTGKKLSDATRKKLSEVRKGKKKKPHTEEFKRLARLNWEEHRGHLRGMKRSPESREKMRQAQLRRGPSPLLGRKLSEEMKRKLSFAKIEDWKKRKQKISPEAVQ